MKKDSIAAFAAVLLILTSANLRADNNNITKTGIGEIQIGAVISSLPNSLSGVYDKLVKVTEEEYDDGDSYTYDVYHATMNGEAILDIYPDGDKVRSITVYSNRLKTEKGLSLASTPADIITAGGHVVSFNNGDIAIVNDGILFFGMPMTQDGYKKAEQAYLGQMVSIETSDFDAKGHPNRIVIMENEYSDLPIAGEESSVNSDAKGTTSSGLSAQNILLGILFIAALLAMIGHMVYVNYFSKKFPEEIPTTKGMDNNNAYVLSRLNNLYNNEFTPLDSSDDSNYPVGKQAALNAKKELTEIFNNHTPVDGDAAVLLQKVSVVTNDSFKRSFAGSIMFMILTIAVGAGACILNKDATPLIYFVPSCVLYFFSCMTPNYILLEKALKEQKTGKSSKNIMGGILAGVFGLAATAPVVVEITKDASTGEVLKKENDHTLQLIGLVASILLFIILAYAMLFVGVFNYLRNYVIRSI